MLKRYLDGADKATDASVVCLGLFDGVHLGHRQIVLAGRQVADKLGLQLCVHTYDIPPMRLIRQGRDMLELTLLEEKCRLLHQAGADQVAVSHFDERMMHMTGKVFFQEVLIGALGARHLVAGFDHRFGFHGDTDIKALRALCHEAGIGLSVLDAVTIRDGLIVSSSAIRAAIRQGDQALAEAMLGRLLDPRLLSLLNTRG